MMRSIFVSSTFRDMQSERDMLHMYVIPELNARARRYGESISFIDLRWGVNTGDLEDEEGSRKVLSVCLDEINRSRPYMLILLGDRYGWIPDGRLIKSAALEKEYTVDDMEKSVTALEIEYGALSGRGALDNCIVCIREPLPYELMDEESRLDYQSEGPGHMEKLERLKDRVRKLLGDKVITYRGSWDTGQRRVTGLESLGAELIIRFSDMLGTEWNRWRRLSWQEKELQSFRLFVNEKCNSFAGRERLLAEYERMLMSESAGILILQGVAGSGKSSMMCMLAIRLGESGCKVFPFICGNGVMSMTAEDMLRQMVYYMECLLGKTEHFGKLTSMGKTPEEWQQALNMLVSEYEANGKEAVVFVLDALDQLTETDMLRSFGFLPSYVPGKVRFVLSCLDSFQIPVIPGLEPYIRTAGLPLLEDKSEIREVMESMLAAVHKGLDEVVINSLLSKEETKNPLYSAMLLQRLMMMDSKDLGSADNAAEMNARMLDIIGKCPADIEGICASVMDEAGNRINRELSHLVLPLLSAARHGLREADLEAISADCGISWSGLDFSRLIKYLHSFFLFREDGRYDFSHKAIREGFKSASGKSAEYDRMILNHIRGLPADDTLRLNEGIYHAQRVGDGDFLNSQLEYAWRSKGDVEAIIAGELWKACRMDGGSWLCSNIAKNELLMHSPDAISFLHFDFDNYSDAVQRDHVIALEVYGTLLNNVVKVPGVEDTDIGLVTLANCLIRLGDQHNLVGKPDEALPCYDKALSFSRKVCRHRGTAESKWDVAVGCHRMGSIYRSIGNYAEAAAMYEEALGYCKEIYDMEATPERLSGLAENYEKAGSVYLQMGERSKALTYLERVLKYREELHNTRGSMDSLWDLADCCKNLGRACNIAGCIPESIDLFERCYSCGEELHRAWCNMQSLGMLAEACDGLGQAYIQAGRPDRALELYKRATRYREQLHRLQDNTESLRALAICNAGLGDAYGSLGRWDMARDIYEKVLSELQGIYESRKDMRSLSDIAEAYNRLGDACKGLEDLAAALKYHTLALECSQGLNEVQNNPDSLEGVADSLMRVGGIYLLWGQPEEASRFFKEALEHSERLYKLQNDPSSRRRLAQCFSCLGDASFDCKEWDKAEEYYKINIQHCNAMYDSQPTVNNLRGAAASINSLGLLYRAALKPENSISCFESCLKLGELLYKKMDSLENLKAVAVSCYYLGEAYQNVGQAQKAFSVFIQYRDYIEKLCGQLSNIRNLTDAAAINVYLGDTYKRNGQPEKALPFFWSYHKHSRELHRLQASLESLTEAAAGSLYLGDLLYDKGQTSEALGVYQEYITYCEQLHEVKGSAESLRSVALACERLGDAFYASGQPERALVYYMRELQYGERLQDRNVYLYALQQARKLRVDPVKG